jgi:hypothetical protein
MVNGTIKTFNETIKNVEDKTQDMMITSLNIEIVELNDFNYKMD